MNNRKRKMEEHKDNSLVQTTLFGKFVKTHFPQTVTITFGEVAENHIGMEHIGTPQTR